MEKQKKKEYTAIFPKGQESEEITFKVVPSINLAQIREHYQIGGHYLFLNKKGKKIAKKSEQDYEVSEIANDNDQIKLQIFENQQSPTKQSKTQQKQSQQAAQQKQQQSRKSLENLQESKCMLKDVQQNMDKQENLMMSKKTSFMSKLFSAGNETNFDDHIENMRNGQNKNILTLLEEDGSFLIPIHLIKKDKVKMGDIIDYNRCDIKYSNGLCTSTRNDYTSYQSTQISTLKTTFGQKTKFSTIQGKLQVPLLFKLSGGHTKDKLEQTSNLKKNFQSGQRIFQQFVGVSVRKVVYTPKNGIALTKQAIIDFQKICQLHEKRKQPNKFEASVLKVLSTYLNEYGHYIEGGQYYIGGTYFASTEIVMEQAMDYSKAKDILTKQSQITLNSGLSIKGGLIKAGGQGKKLTKQQSGTTAISQEKTAGYKTIRQYHIQPYIQGNIQKWHEAIEANNLYWRILHKQGHKFGLWELLSTTKNQLSDKITSQIRQQVLNKLKQLGNMQIVSINGNKYFGPIKNRLRQGKGQQHYASGDYYVGEFAQNKKEGFGQYTKANGSILRGNWKADKMHGKGQIIMAKQHYDGQFQMGQLTGNAIHKLTNSWLYIGKVVKGLRHGQGKLFGNNNKYYKQGNWVQGKLQGKGKSVTSIGVYEGNFVHSLMHGQGSYIYDNGDRFDGQFEKDKKLRGMYNYKAGHRYVGSYVNDKKEGNGEFVWSNSNTYNGEYKDGKMHGKGVKKDFINKKLYKGEWKNDEFQGKAEKLK